ncbi:MAG: biosynthetic-type acetolactate synthase large subunit [Oscillospiraceae bacterium]|nr:biosynthetic-type acetolactate synthase large subunit [Oscillospiraceae bacterium]
MIKSGSEIILECLLEQNVNTVFGYPGGAVLNIYDALYDYKNKINHILTAHEQGATHAADGYARSTGKPGVVIATSGPGATNTVTGIATAYMDSIPLIVITGNVATQSLGLDSFQEVDITGITMPITKHNFIVKDVTKLADTIREAFKIATSGRKGPILIDVPKDITAAKCEYTPKNISNQSPKITKSNIDVDDVVEILKESKRPFIYTGGGCNSSKGADNEIAKFAELLDAPVSSSLMGQGSFDNFNKRYIGMLGMHGTRTSSIAVTNCDLFIAIGTRFSDRVTLNVKKFATNAKIIHIDIDQAEINKNLRAHKTIIGDVKEVLSLINSKLPQCSHTAWMEQINLWGKKFPLVQSHLKKGDVTPKELIETLCKLTNGDALISTEVGQHQMWTAQYYNFKKPKQFLTSGGLGTMGFGLGCAIGAKIANPEKTVINIAGDGSFQMNCNELVTIAKYNIPIIEIVLNNQVLGMVRQWQRLIYNKRFSQTTLNRPTDLLKLANAYGIKAYRINKANMVEKTLKKALISKCPVLIEAVINKDMNVLPMVHAGGDINDPIMEIKID